MTLVIADLAARTTQGIHNRAACRDFVRLARLIARDKFSPIYAQGVKDATNKRVREILEKTVVGAGSLTDWSAIGEYRNLSDAFSESLRTVGVFDAMLPYIAPAPLRSRGVTVTTGISGAVVGEGQIKVISKLVLGNALVEPRKAQGSLILTQELLHRQDPAVLRLLENELRRAVVAATDSVFLAELVAATTPAGSAGSTLAQITSDISTLVSAVTTGENSQLFFICSPANMKKLSLKQNSVGSRAFENLGPNGGTLMPGVTAIASNSIASDVALLVDATLIAGSADIIELSRSPYLVAQLVDSNPDSPETASTVQISLWQHGLQWLIAERFFGFVLTRATACASLNSVSW
jgi:hypothetical protein